MDNNRFVITDKGVLKEYHGDDKVLQIPDGVRVIDSGILCWPRGPRGKNVRKLIIPEGVVEIKERAFIDAKISEVMLPSTLKTIGAHAFDRCAKLKSIVIPEGVRIIPDSAFCWMSRLEEVTLPDSIEEIGQGAFQHCYNLRKINFSNLASVKIGPQAFTGCDALVDESGLFILQNRVFTYHSETKNAYVVIPDGITDIELGAFHCCDQIHLEMSVNCPSWIQTGTAKMYGFARSLLDSTGSSITFRDADGKKVAYVVLANKDETVPKQYGAVLSLKSENGRFDFAGYDTYFASLAKVPNRIAVALARVEYPYEISEEMLGVYESFLKKQAVAVGTMLIDEDRIETLEMLGEKQLLTANAVIKLIDYAKSKDKVAITAWLLEYNNTMFGKSSVKKTKAVVSALKLTPVKTDAEPVKSAAEWRKEFKFKYKDGGVIITEYLGSDECVTIPEKIGNKYVIGLAEGTFECMGFDGAANTTTKKIIVPGTILSIESGAIRIVENMEIEIQEGIKDLPKWAIDIVSNVIVKLPASIMSIGEQFRESDTESIKMIVPQNSCAEKFCKKSKLSYTTYVPTISADSGKGQAIKEQLTQEKKQATSKKAVTPWKKPKAGTHLIPRYLGRDTEVVFPTEVDGVSIDGIANTAGDTPDNYKSIISIVIPEGYTYIGNKAFSGCENLETIHLPSTLREIGTQAFAGCKKLKEIIIRKEITFVGKDIFTGADIGTVVIETEKKTKIPLHLFFGCRIKNLVVIGGPFKSNGNVFDYTGVAAGVKYAEKLYEGNFPEAIYINGDFTTLDLKGTGGSNAKRIHPMADIDESIISDQTFREIAGKEKSKKGVVNANKVVESVTVDSIDFASSEFVLAGFDYDEEYDVIAAIQQRSGNVNDSVTADINYLVIPDRDIVNTPKTKKAIQLQEKGAPINIIRLSECKRHMAIHDEKNVWRGRS